MEIYVDIDGHIGYLRVFVDICSYLWICVDVCGYIGLYVGIWCYMGKSISDGGNSKYKDP